MQPADVYVRSMKLLQTIQRLGAQGFAKVLDQASEPELVLFNNAIETVERQIAKTR